MLRAIIIDDEQQGINNIKLLIGKFIKGVQVVTETTKAAEGITLIDHYKPDIVFLDIKMPHMNGFELLKQLNFKEFALIFTTAHEEFALQAIKNNALDYLLKPVDIDDLKEAINKAKKRLTSENQLSDLHRLLSKLNFEPEKILFNAKDRLEHINKNDIIRLEAKSNYTNVYYCGGNKLSIAKTIGDYDALLCDSNTNFMRIHHSHIVNLRHVKKFIKNIGIVITTDDYEVPISKTNWEEFIKWLDVV
jgi:two-component system LytT family response regulator